VYDHFHSVSSCSILPRDGIFKMQVGRLKWATFNKSNNSLQYKIDALFLLKSKRNL